MYIDYTKWMKLNAKIAVADVHFEKYLRDKFYDRMRYCPF